MTQCKSLINIARCAHLMLNLPINSTETSYESVYLVEDHGRRKKNGKQEDKNEDADHLQFHA